MQRSMTSCSPLRTPNSYFWMFPFAVQLMNLPFVHDVTLHSCMRGGSRNKQTHSVPRELPRVRLAEPLV